MHLEPNNERTPSNTKRLRLKGFHKRQILVKAIKNLFVFKAQKPRKEIHGSGSGGNRNIIGSFSYVVESIKKTTYKVFYYKRSFHDLTVHKHYRKFTKTFNKQQLPGKLILIGKKYYRICSN